MLREDGSTGSEKFSSRVPASMSMEKVSSEGGEVSGINNKGRGGRAKEGGMAGTTRPSMSVAKLDCILTNVLVADVAKSRFSFNVRISSSDSMIMR